MNTESNQQTGSRLPKPYSHTGIRALYLFYFLAQLPFLSSALRIDEPYYVWVAEHISRFPWDPYGTMINWYGSPQSAFEALPNPPLVPFCLAIWRNLFFSGETAAHSLALLFSLLALHGFGLIAGHLNLNKVCAALLLLCSPGFFLASQVAMLDMPMLALLLLSAGYTLRYIETGRTSILAIAFLSAFLCPLAKYGGVLIAPLAACLAISCRKRLAALVAVAPLLSIFLWNLFCWHQYGEFHLSAVRRLHEILGHEPPLLTAVGLAARFGFGIFPLILLKPVCARVMRRRLWPLHGVVLLGMLGLGFQIGLPWMPSLLLAFSVTVFALVTHAVGDLGYEGLKAWDKSGIFLSVWVAAGLLLQIAMPYTAVRHLIPLAAPIILLLLKHSGWTRPTMPFLAGCAANLLFVSSLAIGDAAIAEGYRSVVREEIVPRVNRTAGRFYFSGHWGFQYYAQLAGGQVIDSRNEPEYRAGDWVVIPITATPDIQAPKLGRELLAVTSVVAHTPKWPVRTVDAATASNFYGSWTPGAAVRTLLPFGISTSASDVFTLHLIRENKP